MSSKSAIVSTVICGAMQRHGRSACGAAMDFNRNLRHDPRNSSAMAEIDPNVMTLGNSFTTELRGRMRKLGQPAILFGFLLTMLVSATAVGDDMVAIRISNDGTDDIVVTVYDMNAQPPGAVVIRQKINGFAWIPVSVTAGAAGMGHVLWTATSAKSGLRQCGHHDERGLRNDDTVQVFADSPCVPRARRPPPGTY
jgi:hypothetical protein